MEDYHKLSLYSFKKNKLLNSEITNLDDFSYLENRNSDTFLIDQVSSLNSIKENSILFINKKNLINFLANKINFHIVTDDSDLYDNPKISNITLVKDLDKSYIQIIRYLFLDEDQIGYKDEFKTINGSSISINAQIDVNVRIEPNCTIHRGVTISKNCIIKSNSSLSNAFIDEFSIIGQNSTIGSTGFGFNLMNLGSSNLLPHIGNVSISKNVRIGSSCTIDRARIDTTYIGANSMLDNSIHIAHNVSIDDNACIAAQCGISGSVKIGKNLIMGGQSGIAGHLTIGDNVRIAAKSGVTKNISSNSTIAGFPAIDIKDWKKLIIRKKKNGHK